MSTITVFYVTARVCIEHADNQNTAEIMQELDFDFSIDSDLGKVVDLDLEDIEQA
jgi:hypothetical protein